MIAQLTEQSIGQPLFDLPLSGWYWQVTRLDQQKPEVHSSRSLWDSALPRLDERKFPPDATGSRRGYVEGPEKQRLRVIERTIDLDGRGRWLIAVTGDVAEIEYDIWNFDKPLSLVLGALAFVIFLVTLFLSEIERRRPAKARNTQM